jgi:cytochrome c5
MVVGMTRQRKYQLKRKAEGRCAQCGNEELLIANHCHKCHEKQLAYARKRNGHNPWEPGKVGRPPKYGRGREE